MKRLILMGLLPVTAFAKSLNSYAEIINSINEGHPIHVRFDLTQCTPGTELIGYYSPRAVMATSKAIVFSDYHVTYHNPNYPEHRTAEYIRYQITPEGAVNIEARFLPKKDAQKDYEPSLYQTVCRLGEQVIVYDWIDA